MCTYVRTIVKIIKKDSEDISNQKPEQLMLKTVDFTNSFRYEYQLLLIDI